ncbi:MAG TPA: DUF1993 domain-containing protein [Tahibacter sp.]|uniref:DUF1993 domain-containing protein n=1 Tax=Tahibacter sp. TaxID=2056211 RepID=UPI002C6A0A9E|nr:DUF1993 domain-containing protein [Tahibacter sp.]HSX62517.1 DUF1993 domain-containing protein [Tahibacter sp.]
MTLSIAQLVKTTVRRNLTVLDTLLDKAAAFAAGRNFDAGVLLGSRLAPDMFPLTRQVQIACDMGKFMAARLAGQKAPVFEDVETTLPELKERIAKTLAYVDSVDDAAFDGAEQREVRVPTRAEELVFQGRDYLVGFAVPNFYFHVTAVYLILRHNGVELGKRDFIGGR